MAALRLLCVLMNSDTRFEGADDNQGIVGSAAFEDGGGGIVIRAVMCARGGVRVQPDRLVTTFAGSVSRVPVLDSVS